MTESDEDPSLQIKSTACPRKTAACNLCDCLDPADKRSFDDYGECLGDVEHSVRKIDSVIH